MLSISSVLPLYMGLWSLYFLIETLYFFKRFYNVKMQYILSLDFMA